MARRSYSLVGFLAVSVLGILLYGVGLASPWVRDDRAIPVGLAGAAVFGIGEGCVMVAARSFVGLLFVGGDGAFAQGVLIAANNLSMMASKNLVPWLIEADDGGGSIRAGVAACLAVMLSGLLAGALYMRLCVQDVRRQALVQRQRKECGGSLDAAGARAEGPWDPERQGLLRTRETEEDRRPPAGRIEAATKLPCEKAGGEDCGEECKLAGARQAGMLTELPLTFWIIAWGRAIFLVTFKVFSRYSNSFLIERFGADAVRAGRLSSVNELFALFSPLVGLLAFRSPGGIIVFALGAALLGAFSIGSLALLSAEGVDGLPGGVLLPLVGISVAHGIIIPIVLAIIPHTVRPGQMGMAFAVLEVLGNTMNLTEIAFGWLRDLTGNYDAAMKLLLGYAAVGTCLLWASRERIGLIGIGASSRRRR